MRCYLLLIFAAALLLASCAPVSNVEAGSSTCGTTACIAGSNVTSTVEKVEVYHFHGTNQCNSCITVGAYAEETVSLFFSEQLKSGKIVFGHINGELPENQELVMKYGATGSSLWIGVYNSSGFYPEQNVNVWYKINNKAEYMNYLKDLIDKRLAGDMS
jgi:hypothetical protein